MNRFKIFVAFVLMVACAPVSEAQVARVFVSLAGNDGNDCLQPPTACRTLNGGIGKVDTGGEVILIDTGSYAGATITKSVKINVPSGNVAFSGLPITINAPGATVVLRGLTLKAVNSGTGIGVNVQAAAAVFIENCVIDGWYDGLSMGVAGKLFIDGTTFRNNVNNGIFLQGANLFAAVDGARFDQNGYAGLLALNGPKVEMTRTVMTQNQYGAGSGGAATVLTLDQCEVSNHSSLGVTAELGSLVRVSNSTVTGNLVGLNNSSSTLESFGNNVVRFNTTQTAGTITTVAKQ